MRFLATFALLTALSIPTKGYLISADHAETVGSVRRSSNATPVSDAKHSDSWCHGNGKGEIYFYDRMVPNTTMIIATPWKIRYPSQLKEALRKTGFVVTENTAGVIMCGWLEIGSANYVGVKRGTLGYRALSEQDKGPINDTIERIGSVLKDEFPALEVFLVCFLSTCGAFFIWVGLLGLRWLWLRSLWHLG